MALPSRIDEALRSLQQSAPKWRDMPGRERAIVARACRRQLATLDMAWMEDEMRCLGIDPSEPDAYNTKSMDPFVFMSIVSERLDKAVDALEGRIQPPKPERQLPDGGPLVYPFGKAGASAPGCTLELWASSTPDATTAAAAGAAAENRASATIVLAAGNQNFLTCADVLERSLLRGECVLLKLHPLRPFMADAFAHIFAPMAAHGAYAQVLDADVAGAHGALVAHPAVSHIHLTGGGSTHDKIVAALDAAGRGDIGLTSELGCITPWIVCPGVANGGVWQESEIEHHALMLTSAFKSSCSMNCLSPKVLVLPSERLWPQRARFLQTLRRILGATAQMPPYYPGAHQRFAAFEHEYADAEKIEAPPAQSRCGSWQPYPGQNLSQLPSLLVDVGTIGSTSCRKYALEHEAFAPVLAIATVESSSTSDFALAAARAMNQHVFGTLSCTLIYPDARDAALDAALRELNYGAVAVNAWTAMGYGNSLGVWGGAPGSYSRSNPQSGLDFIGNAAAVPNPQKTVLVGPFVNAALAGGKLPVVVLESLRVVLSGKRFVFFRVLGVLVRTLFSLAPWRRMCAPRS